MINEATVSIWGRQFALPVKYDCYSGETVTDDQKRAFETFLKHIEWIEQAKRKVQEYCAEAVQEDDNNSKKENMFSYIKPECIFIKHDKDSPRVALMCKYRYDLEHGLAIVFHTNGKIVVGLQDIIL